MSSDNNPFDLVRKMSRAEDLIDVKVILCEVVDLFGGPQAFAAELVHSIQAAEEGKPLHINAMTTLMKALLSFGYVADGDGVDDEESIIATLEDVLKESDDGSNESG